MKDLNVDPDLSSSDESDARNLPIVSGSSENECAMTETENERVVRREDPPSGSVPRPAVEECDRFDELTEKVSFPKTKISHFDILKVLGKGAYGKVYQVRKTDGVGSGRIYAMKAMNKARICGSRTDVRHTKAERDVLVTVHHPFVVKLHFAFETSKRLYLVQEFCCGGELFRRMEVERLMLEKDAKFYLQEILLALEYLHQCDVVYRDLKTENVMLDREGHVKLIDFGLSKTNMQSDTLTKTFCGTVEYMAPEVILRNGYGRPADWWSFGIFTFDLLTGRSPFHSNQGKQATKDRILKAKFNSPRIMTPEAIDFVRRLLRKNIDRRLGTTDGASELKSHMFFKDTDWDMVMGREYEPPFVPHVVSDTDVQHFDEQFTSRTPRESNAAVPAKQQPDKEEEQVNFDDFDFVSDEFLKQIRTSSVTTSESDAASSGGESSASTTASPPAECDNPSCESSSLKQISNLRICGCGT